MIDIIQNNPYRILGVYSTSSKKEMVANQGKMKAFLKVGKPVVFELDFNDILGAIDRTSESVSDADSKLTLANEQLRYAQFWFCRSTPFDDVAFNHLLAENIDNAILIWEKKENVSSLQNRMVCAFIKDDINSAILYAERLYSNYADEFIKMVLGSDSTLTSDNLSNEFLDNLCSYIKPETFIQYISNDEWKTYVGAKTTKPLIDKIHLAIEMSKKSKGQGATARYNAGAKLMNDTKPALAQLNKFLNKTDLQYQMIADKLAQEILQCGIDYYNDSEDSDAAHKAMKLQKYAQSVVVGRMAKDRCRENVKILEEIISNLPPIEIFSEDKKIKDELLKFCNFPDKISYSISLLNSTKPSLQSIKAKLGASNSYYLKISTQVVGNALHNLIEELNGLQNDQTFKLNMILDKQQALSSLKAVLRNAWQATIIMDSFDMEAQFKSNRYNANRESLKEMCDQFGITTYSSSNNSESNTNWGCVIAVLIVVIIFIINIFD